MKMQIVAGFKVCIIVVWSYIRPHSLFEANCFLYNLHVLVNKKLTKRSFRQIIYNFSQAACLKMLFYESQYGI